LEEREGMVLSHFFNYGPMRQQVQMEVMEGMEDI
jgi:hypothetical protein